MPARLPHRVLVVAFSSQPPLAEAVAAAFGRRGVSTRIFHSWPCNTLFDRLIIHPVNHWAHNLRLVSKGVDLFQGHPKSHKEHRSRELLRLFREFQPDLVLLTGVQRFTPEVLPELQRSSPVFFWFTESEKRFGEIETELTHCHRAYFISTAALEEARRRGFERVRLLQHCLDKSQFYPLDLPKIYDWCFVGQWHERRQQYVEGLAKVSRNFVLYGTRWRKRNWRQPALWRRIRGRGIWGEPLTRLYNQTRVVINISVWGAEHQGGAGVNMRLLEVPACGACLLSDYSRDAALLLTPEQEFVSAASLPEMQERLRDLLADDQKRRRIAQAGYQRAVRSRSYDDLVEHLCRDWAAADW